MTNTIADALRSAVKQLEKTSDSARIDAEVLLAQALDKPRSYLFSWPEKTLSSTTQQLFADLVNTRSLGRPIAYITGVQEFWSLPLRITPDTLIPRPETELLVELALQHINNEDSCRILDLGTGSGAIALAIASERPNAAITACDYSSAALSVAQQNADALSITNIEWVESDWYANVPASRYDLILSNPPYIEEGDSHLNVGDVVHEPRTALVSGAEGLDAIRTIVAQAMDYLSSGGLLMFEHGFSQGEAARAILSAHGYTEVQTKPDLQNLDRVSVGRFRPAVD